MTLSDRRRFVVAPFLMTALGMVGCSAVGPPTVSRDRFDYNGEIARSWKEQTLLNIVRARYSDMPLFLEVSQVVSGYTLESTVSAGLLGARSNAVVPPGSNLTFGAQGKWTDRPTITYTPLTGQQFNRSMLTPIPPAAVLFAMQAGWPIDLVFRLVVHSINGLNSTGRGAASYERVIHLMRALQDSELVGMRLQGGDKAEQAVVLFFHTRTLAPEEAALVSELRGLLRLVANRSEFHVRFGAAAANEGEVAMLTRSMLQILIDLGEYVDVPVADIRDGRAYESKAPPSATLGRLLAVRFTKERPVDTLTAVEYRGGWYSIDDRDIASKRTFAMVMIFSTLADSGAREAMPLVTIPG